MHLYIDYNPIKTMCVYLTKAAWKSGNGKGQFIREKQFWQFLN